MELWHSLLQQVPMEWAQFAFMRNAMLGVILIAPLFALLGSILIGNQMTFFSDAIGHSALTGIAIGVIAGLVNPLGSMIAFSILLAITITLLRHYTRIPSDTAVGLIMSAAVALGVVLLSRGGSFSRYSSFLVGDILAITPAGLTGLLLLLVIVTGLWMGLFNRFLLVSLSRSLARSRGIHVLASDLALTCVVAVVVTVSIPWMGLLVVNSLLTIPAAAARHISRSTVSYVWGTLLVSLLSGVLGLISSFYWNTATGATIVLYAMAFFAASLLIRRR
jgi:zinc transport system permease protein